MTARTASSEPITLRDLVSILHYDAAAGVFRWRVRASPHRRIGDIAGGVGKDGYWLIKVEGKRYAAHRLAWFCIHQRWPAGDIDHIDGNRSNNRIENLRDVTRSVNLQNQRAAKSHNAIGLLGVRKRGNRFAARIDKTHLGYFDTPEDAHAAYVAAKRVLHEGCAI